jgi:diguanylate cyclase (GGDEF)-like protein/PAS domain S-box-containing protein
MSPPHNPSRRASLLGSGELDRARVLDTLVNNLDGMAYRCLPDASWHMIFVSQGCRALTGYRADQLLGDDAVSWELITHPEDRQRVRSLISAAVLKSQRFAVEYRIVTQDGTPKWVIERGVGVTDEQGEPVIEGFIEDVTDQHALMEAREQADRRYREIFEKASEGIFQTSPDGHYLAANPALARLYGYTSPQDLINGLQDIQRQLYVMGGQRERFQRMMAQHDVVLNFESEIYRQDGSRIWISENAHAVRDPQGQLLYYEGTVQDISERKSYQEQLERQANHDSLTGLPNRNLLSDRIEQGIARAARLGYHLVVVFIDLDNFKFVNDSLGHDAGDELLREMAQRLGHCVRGSDTVARLGGDEFVLLLNDHFESHTVLSVLHRVLQEVSRPMVLRGREFQVSTSMGVALYPRDGDDSSSLLKNADAAMYAAKDRGRNSFQFFTSELNREAEERLNLESALRQAIEQNALEVHYQPKFDRRRRVVGLEALVRWHHPDYGPVRPDRFIPIAEETGLIVPLTHAVMRAAIAAAVEWNRGRSSPLHMAVNLSPKLFQGGDVVAQLSELLAEAGLPAGLLELEITESVFIGDSERALQTLNRLKELGVLLAMDDFGTGYSSLSYLRRLPVDIIKIDRSLVTGLEHEDDAAMIARAVISLGQSLRKVIVAEGVENQAQFDFLRFQGCDEFQGYLLSRPLPAADITRLLQLAPPPAAAAAGPTSGFAPPA